MHKIITTTICSLVLSNSYGFNINNYLNNLSIDLAYGSLNTESHEYVYYNENSKSLLSKLEWTIEDAPIIRSNINYHIPNIFDINVNGWHSLSKKRGLMDDYDWMNPNTTGVTHWSTHDNTTLKKAHEIDFNINRNLIEQNKFNLEFTPILGYHQNYYSFVAKGGTAYYPEGIYKFNDNIKGISYQQTFATPYLGFNTGLGYNKFTTLLNYKYGLKLRSKDIDNHHLRSTTFETVNTNNDAKFASLALKAKYKFSKTFEFFGDAIAQGYTDHRGKLTIKDPDEIVKYDNIAGYDNITAILGTGFSYIF